MNYFYTGISENLRRRVDFEERNFQVGRADGGWALPPAPPARGCAKLEDCSRELENQPIEVLAAKSGFASDSESQKASK